MKKSIFTTLFFVLLSIGLSAQKLLPEMQATYDACLQLQSAIGAGNTTGLREANQMLKNCETDYFNSMRVADEDLLPSLNGHFVFDHEFVDSLILNRCAYQFAQRYAERCAERGTSSAQGKVFMRTCSVGGKSSIKFTFTSRGHQELAFVTEPRGSITVRVHDVKHDKWYNDNTKENKGLPSRIRIFDLPTNELSTIEVEVLNRSKEDISFVVISN